MGKLDRSISLLVIGLFLSSRTVCVMSDYACVCFILKQAPHNSSLLQL